MVYNQRVSFDTFFTKADSTDSILEIKNIAIFFKSHIVGFPQMMAALVFSCLRHILDFPRLIRRISSSFISNIIKSHLFSNLVAVFQVISSRPFFLGQHIGIAYYMLDHFGQKGIEPGTFDVLELRSDYLI